MDNFVCARACSLDVSVQFFLDDKQSKSKPAEETSINPVLNYSRTILIDPVTDDFIEYLKSGLMEIQVWGQRPNDETKRQEEENRRAKARRQSVITAEQHEQLEELAKVREKLQLLGVDNIHGRNLSVSQQVEEMVKAATLKIS